MNKDEIKDILTPEQDKRAFDWMNEHSVHVKRLIKESNSVKFSPSLYEDKNDPRLWKPGYWAWYVDKKMPKKTKRWLKFLRR